MNSVILMGTIANEPNWVEEKYCKFTVAVPRKYAKDKERETDFIPCIAFGKMGDFVGRFFRKSSRILVDGEIRTGSYEDREGRKVYTTNVVVNSAEFCEKANLEKPQKENPNPGKEFGFYQQKDDDGLPFD